ncbi:MAG: MoaD/ThiS family protein [Candidatus Thorarchaeota archaeon]|nr:MAG: hypothetical protein DRP09_12315 [Candidatus Thorarchaeota archaeon]RLI60183.1 MAG: hypothetical protein DRO87_00635 [Candidatus Thorarchaeota archaeon]
MILSIRFRGPFARHFDDGLIEIELEGSSVAAALECVLDSEEVLRSTWKSPEEIDRDSLIMVNNVDIGLSGGLETRVEDGDIVSVLPLVHGG